MSIINGENFFLLLISLLFFGAFLLGPALLIMHFLMPRAVLEKYFKPPYFRPLEVELFTGIPYAPVRTAMFMWVLAFPRFGKKRNLTEAYLLVPRWYRVFSALFSISLITVFVSVLLISSGFYLYFEILGYD